MDVGSTMDVLLAFGGLVVVMVVVCLVVRESTEQRLRRLRAELMQLRSQVRVLEDRMKSYETVRSQVREVLSRIDSRKLSTNDAIENIYDKLRQLYEFLREEELPPMDNTATSKQEQEEAEEVNA